MRDGDGLDNNPLVSRSALEAIHDQVFGWALSRSDYDRTVAEDLVQQAYVELLNGRARFDGRSTLKTFVFGIVQNLSRSRYRRIASRFRLLRRLCQVEGSPLPVRADKGIGRIIRAVLGHGRRPKPVLHSHLQFGPRLGVIGRDISHPNRPAKMH